MIFNSQSRWGSVAQCFHWLIAVMIYFSIITGLLWWLRKYTHVGVGVISNHKTIGLAILLLVIMRLIWRWTTRLPQSHDSLSTYQTILIRASHWLILILIVIMPVSGWMMSTAAGYKTNIIFTKVSMPFVHKSAPLAKVTTMIHHWAGWVLLALVMIHAFVAYWHHWVRKDPSLIRMLPRVIARKIPLNKKK